jgi:hypothetical protein
MKAKIEKKPEGDHFLNLSPDNKEDELLISLFESWRIIGRLEEELASKNQECDDWMNQNKYLVEQVTNRGGRAGTEALDQLNKEVISLRSEKAKLREENTNHSRFREIDAEKYNDLLDDCNRIIQENAELKRQLAAMTKTVFPDGKNTYPEVDINHLFRYISVATDPITKVTFTYDNLKENPQSVFRLIEIIRNAYENRLGVIHSGEIIRDKNDLP